MAVGDNTWEDFKIGGKRHDSSQDRLQQCGFKVQMTHAVEYILSKGRSWIN
jgi:hypothetical protein